MPKSSPIKTITQFALSLPETEQSTSCNKLAFKVGKKNFLFLGEKDTSYNIMLKLEDSLDDAIDLQKKQPETYSVGSAKWVTINYKINQSPPKGLIEKWTTESFRLIVNKKISDLLTDPPSPTQKTKSKKKTTKKKTTPKKATTRNPSKSKSSKSKT